MLRAPRTRGFSRSLLGQAIRFGSASEAARQRLLAAVRAHDASSEDHSANHDSPWRSIALLLRDCGDLPGARLAFVRALRWFDKAGAEPSRDIARAGALQTLHALCRVQAGETATISSAQLIDVIARADRANPNGAPNAVSHFSTNRRRVAFLARYYRLAGVLPADERWTDPIIAPSVDAEQVYSAIIDTWTAARFSVELANRQMLEERLSALLDGGAALAAACGHLPRTREADGAVEVYIKHYLSAIGFCEPSMPEATRALEQLSAVFRQFGLQHSQSIEARTLALLANSAVRSTLTIDDVSQIVDSLSRDVRRCAELARHLGLDAHRVNSLLRQPLREFVAGDLRQQCLLLEDGERRTEALRKLSFVSEVVGALDANTVKELASHFTVGQALPCPLLGSAAAKAFGAELRRRADRLYADAARSVGQAVQTAVEEECERFFRAAVLEAFADDADTETRVARVREAASVFAAAGVLASTVRVWKAAIFALTHADVPLAVALLDRWMLTVPELRTGLWYHLSELVGAFVRSEPQPPHVAASVFKLLFAVDADKLVSSMFGNADLASAAMLPLGRALVDSNDARSDETLASWLTHAAEHPKSTEMPFACKTVDTLLGLFPDDTSDESPAVLRAARELAGARLAEMNAAAHPHLMQVTALFASAFLRRAGAAELRSRLTQLSGGVSVPLALNASLLTRAEADQVLSLLTRDANTYTSTELADARAGAVDICGRGLANWRDGLSELFVRYVEPEIPSDKKIRSFTSGWTPGGTKPLRHEAAFRCRTRPVPQACTDSRTPPRLCSRRGVHIGNCELPDGDAPTQHDDA